MSDTLTTIDAALKETWTEDSLETQLYNRDAKQSLWARLEKQLPMFEVGAQAVTPVKVGHTGGFSAKPATGGALNTATNVGTAQAIWNYAHFYQPISIESATVDGTSNKALSVANIVDEAVEDAIEVMTLHGSRQLYGNGDALICACGTTSSSTTVTLNATDGPIAIARDFLYEDLVIDIGTTANETSVAADRSVTAVDETNGTVTISGAAVSTAATDYISVANARSGTTSYESNGLQNIVSLTTTLGGIDPATETKWKAAKVDATAQDITIDAVNIAIDAIRQKGTRPPLIVTSLTQQRKLYNLLQTQVRYAGEAGLKAGGTDNLAWNGSEILADPDCHDRHMFFLNPKNMFVVRSGMPFWQNKYTGGKILEWSQGNTNLVATLIYRYNIGINRRNAFAAYTNLNT